MKKTIQTLVVPAVLVTALFGEFAHATNGVVNLASHAKSTTFTYKIKDGYGEYTGVGSSQIQATSQAREECILNKINTYEMRSGQTPDADTADLFIDACINK